MAEFRYSDVAKQSPVQVPSNHSAELDVFLSSKLLQMIKENPMNMQKPLNALNHGFRGYSRGGKNGIFLLRKQDKALRQAFPSLLAEFGEEAEYVLSCQRESLASTRKVKLVWHNPRGARIVGLYNTSRERIFLLDYASY